jgi:hypothetical protein
MLWGDGFEIETVINCRLAAAQLKVTEVGSVERSRIHGESNLNAVRDGIGVLRTIIGERARSKRLNREISRADKPVLVVDDLLQESA